MFAMFVASMNAKAYIIMYAGAAGPLSLRDLPAPALVVSRKSTRKIAVGALELTLKNDAFREVASAALVCEGLVVGHDLLPDQHAEHAARVHARRGREADDPRLAMGGGVIQTPLGILCVENHQ